MYRKSLSYLKILVCAAFMMVTASAVSPSAEAVVVESSGDGMCFYNWMVAPELPTYRPTGYNYSVMFYNSPDGMDPFNDYIYYLYYSNEPLVYDSDPGTLVSSTGSEFDHVWYICTMSDDVSSLLGIDTGVWVFMDEGVTPSISVPSPNWSDFDLYSLDGSEVLSPARDVIPLDGYNVIRWDGIRSDVEISNELAAVGPSLPEPVSAYFVTGNYTSGGGVSYKRGTTVPVSSPISSSSDSWSIGTGDKTYVVSDYTSDTLGFYTAQIFGLGSFTQLLAYKPASDVPVGPDFSNTELIIHESDYDFQSGTVVVGWSNLPNIDYPDDIQYYITARLSDGNPPTHPYTYIGGSDDPPSGDLPIDFTFTDLQPETAYTVTVELRYASGDNASFYNSVPSGVTASVSFTTLSDGSISEGDKAIIDAIQNTSQQHEQWIDSEMGSAVGDLNEDVAAAEQQINDWNNQEEAFKDDAFARFQEVSASFSGFDGTVGSGIGLAGTLFSRFFNCLGDYAIIYTFPLILGLAMVIIGRLGRSSFSLEGKDSEKGGE